jgi:NADPH-dependent 2,4-dienoyl-CoA reductase/sulfur reductase-like enzyme
MGARLVVIGGDAGGMTAAAQARRLDSDLEIVVLERGNWVSYSACGIPYLVGGEVESIHDLVARTPQELRDTYRIDVRLRHEAMAVDLDAREVEVRSHERDRTFRLGFDQLLIATGARPRRPDLPGIDGPTVMGVQTLDDASALLQRVRGAGAGRVVVVGGGYVGLEMAEAFVRRGSEVTVVESSPQVMSTLDHDMGVLVSTAMRRHGIEVRCGTRVEAFSEGIVHTDAGELPADLVILGLGVTPNSELAAEAGIGLGDGQAIRVDRRQATDTEGVWAAGDCCESFHLVTGRPFHIALGTVANKHGRVAGINLGGGYATFPGVVGTAVSKVCSTEVARTGLGEDEARAAGFGCVATTITATTRAGYYPGGGEIRVKMVAERGTGRLLGAQIVGEEGAAKRIDVVATAITRGMRVHELVDLDLSYAPPFSPLWDPVQIAARRSAAAVDG